MFCKYCGNKSKDANGLCSNCKKNGFDFNQNGYGSSRELYDIFAFLKAENSSLKNAVTPEIIKNNPYRKQNNHANVLMQEEKAEWINHQENQQPEIQTEQPLRQPEQMPNKHIQTPQTEPISEPSKSNFKFFIIPTALIALAAAVAIGFASAKLCTNQNNSEDSEPITETTIAATESYSENALVTEIPSDALVTEVPSESTAATTTTTTIASGESAYDFIEMHKNEDMRLAPWPSGNITINDGDYGKLLEDRINNWLEYGDSYRLKNLPVKEKNLSVCGANEELIYNNIEASGAGIKLDNEYYNTVWSNIKDINNNQNYGWLLYDTESCGSIYGSNIYENIDLDVLTDGGTLGLTIDDNVKYNITYHTNVNTFGQQFEMIYSGKAEGYLYMRKVQDYSDGYYVIIHLNNNEDDMLLYMDANNNLYRIKYLLTENPDDPDIIKIISRQTETSDENEDIDNTSTYNDYSNDYSNGSSNNFTSPPQNPIVTEPPYEPTTTPPVSNANDGDSSTDITGDQ